VSAISVNATGHEKACWRECRALGVEGWMLSSFTQKKYRPPRPMGVKGGCSPQNNPPKLRSY